MMSDGEEQYFVWLYSHIGAVTDSNPNHSHWLLAEKLYSTEFEGFVRNDVNRELDGTLLRIDFGKDEDDPIFPEYCTTLEMLIAFSRRIAFESADTSLPYSAGDWFWHMMSNLGLKKYTDDVLGGSTAYNRKVDNIIHNFVNREYSYSGVGGAFPLIHPIADQRKVELWYQMSAYLLENTDIDE